MASVDLITGPYDAIAIVQAETAEEIGSLVMGRVHSISGVSRTVTCVAWRILEAGGL